MTNYKTYQKKPYNITQAFINRIYAFVCIMLFIFTALMFYCNNYLSLYPVSQVSMMPYINPNGIDEDYVYVTSNVKDITYRDLVISKHNQGKIVKRVIAMPGDNLMIKQAEDKNYSFYIQYGSVGEWQKLEEDYIKNKTVYLKSYQDFYNQGSKTFLTDNNGNKYIHLSENQIFLAGDNRLSSLDCIYYGPLKTEDLVGEVVYIIHGSDFRIFQIFKQFIGFAEWK